MISSFERAAALAGALVLVTVLGIAGLTVVYFHSGANLIDRVAEPIRYQLPGYHCPSSIEPREGAAMCEIKTGQLQASADCADTTAVGNRLSPFGDVTATLRGGHCQIDLSSNNQLAGVRLVSGDSGDGVAMADFEVSGGQALVGVSARCQQLACLAMAVDSAGEYEVRERRQSADQWKQLAAGTGAKQLATGKTHRLVFQDRQGKWVAYLDNVRVGSGSFHLGAGDVGQVTFFADNLDSKPIEVSLDRFYLFAAG